MTQTPHTGASVTISGDLIHHVRSLLFSGIRSYPDKKVIRHNTNIFSEDGIISYVVAVAAVEAYINEAFFKSHYRKWFEKAPLWSLRTDWLEKLQPIDKIVIIAELLLRASLRRAEAPLQDFDSLVKIRNEIVHYKNQTTTPKPVAELARRGIALVPPVEGLTQPWIWLVQCTEGIRWAHNTACKVVRALAGSVPNKIDDYRQRGLDAWGQYDSFQALGHAANSMLSNFTEVTEAQVRAVFDEMRINADIPYPGK